MTEANEYPARTHTYESRKLLYVSHDKFMAEEDSEIQPRSDLGRYILTRAHSADETLPVIICNDAASIIYDLDEFFGKYPSFHWRATPLRRIKRGAAKPAESKSAISVHLNPLYCGFKRENGHGRNRYFWFVDCTQVTGNTSGYHYSGIPEIESLEAFGGAYREFCRDNGMPIVGQRGKVGSAFLRDPRFMLHSQRRIPQFINEQTREYLPGNHYELRAETDKPYSGVYLDITSAHHEAAKKTEFPDPAGLRARGAAASKQWADSPLTEIDVLREPWARRGTPKFDAVLRTYGLVALRTLYRGTSKGAILHPAAWTASPNRPNLTFAFTNELETLERSGFTIEAIEAAWTSGRTDRTLNRFAEFAIETLQTAPPEHKPWMKSLLLSSYGMLGKRPSKYQSVSNSKGEPFHWPTPNGWIEGKLQQTAKSRSASVTNVIALGMIQAETRQNIIRLAQTLESHGIRILALYADSLIVDAKQTVIRKGVSTQFPTQLPLLPPEWRVKTGLTHLRFLNAVSWVSEEEEKLPGISRETALRESRRSAIRARARELGHEPSEWLMSQAAVHGIGERRVKSIPTNV